LDDRARQARARRLSMTDVWSRIDLEIDLEIDIEIDIEIDLEMPEAKPRPELGGGAPSRGFMGSGLGRGRGAIPGESVRRWVDAALSTLID
jgi:hypothetical protein